MSDYEEWEDTDSGGNCGNFGHELYQEGTENCMFCEYSEECFKLYKDWLKSWTVYKPKKED